MDRIAKRIAYLVRMIDIHNRTRENEIRLGVNAEWMDAQAAAKREELANLRRVYNDDGSRKPMGMSAQAKHEEARMGRLLRAASRRNAF